ncbi:RING-H2 finger protein ATL46-like [Coffea arabica]|uniref:RING-type E3 ubiquitin transferase n=1 Tax=Coffea arabica TaxID=13443 RepID=A0A6P6X0T3_COFAR|nr:RING-H2 finger protein ATL46-like [Coffea arabica]
MGKISPIVLLVIIILAVIFFVYGLLHLLFRYFMKIPSFSAVSQSNRNRETSGSHALQRQLQQLFHMHDSGLDQALIDALPIFYYKDIMGLKEPFDCAVCLCEFSDQDMLRLLPLCSHAFHLNCIDTWLLSNSTCPLCRSVISSGTPIGNKPLFNFHGSRERSNRSLVDSENEHYCNHKPDIMQESASEMRVFSVRLGKYRSINEEGRNGDHRSDQMEMISSCNLDGRRCYSMGTFQYIVNSEMQVALSDGGSLKLIKGSVDQGNFAPDNTEREGKKICARTRRESFSVSKIWLWSKEESSQSLSENTLNVNSFNVDMPMIEGTH